MKTKNIYVLIALILFLVTPATSAFAEWHFGIGTGFTFLDLDGDIGIDTKSLLLGPVKVPVTLDPGDVNDLMKSAFGVAGYATDGTWKVTYSIAYLELEGDGKARNLSADIDFKTTIAELLVSYPVYKSDPVTLSLAGGLRYTDQEIDIDMTLTRPILGTLKRSNDNENDWTDAVVGIAADVKLAENWSWNTLADAGFGGSEGTYTARTGVTWRFLPSWSTTLSAKYAAVEFEDGNKGDLDWYLYDVDETYLGLGVLYNW